MVGWQYMITVGGARALNWNQQKWEGHLPHAWTLMLTRPKWGDGHLPGSGCLDRKYGNII